MIRNRPAETFMHVCVCVLLHVPPTAMLDSEITKIARSDLEDEKKAALCKMKPWQIIQHVCCACSNKFDWYLSQVNHEH